MSDIERQPAPGPGAYFDVPEEIYHSWDAFSKSQVAPLIKSPAHLQAYLKEPLDTACIRLGSLTDTVVFEPDQFLERFSVRPQTYKNDKGEVKPWNGNSKVCKQLLEQLEAADKPIITNADYQEAMALRDACRHHTQARKLLQGGRAQVSLVWDDSETSVRCKCRLDWLTRHEHIADLKTTRDASAEGFPREINKYKYHVQAAVYIEAAEIAFGEKLPFYFIAAEKPARKYTVGVYRLGDDSILAGRSIWGRALHHYKACRENNNWPGYSQFIEPIDIPAWAIRSELGEETSNVQEF